MFAKHLFHQTPVIRAIVRVATGRTSSVPTGQTLEEIIEPRPRALVDDYLRWCDARGRYANALPPHLFPQWLFPLQARCIPHAVNARRVLNAGGRFTLSAPLPRDETMVARCRLDEVDDDERRTLLTFVCTTGPRGDEERLSATLTAIVKKRGAPAPKQLPAGPAPSTPKPSTTASPRSGKQTPIGLRPLRRFRFKPADAEQFVFLTGDINPIHWSKSAARQAGFKNTILHGYATAARVYEAIGEHRGEPPSNFEFRFTRPLVLPATPRLYLRDEHYWLSDGPGMNAYAIGSAA